MRARTPAAARAWEFLRGHRWGFAAVAGYVVALAAVRLVDVATGRPISLDPAWRFPAMVIVPSSASLMYLLAVFSFGFGGDLAGRASIYPTRLFTQPVTSAALAGWPMLYGTATVAGLWLAVRGLAPWPPGLSVPVAWPALLAAALAAWTQALMWMPYGLPGLRVVAALLCLVALDIAVVLALHLAVRETVMLAVLAPLVPLAYVAARLAVARARRGEVPDWWGWWARRPRRAGLTRRHFVSASRAQAWFEWRRHGRSLPALVAVLLPFELALLPLARDAPVLLFEILLGVLLTPPLMAAFAAATVRKANAGDRNAYGVAPFQATRPVTSAALVAAKLSMALRSTLLAWALVLVAVPAALALTGTAPMAADGARRFVAAVGTPRAVAFTLLGGAALVSSTWKQLVQSLYVGLSGREWAVKANVFLGLILLTAVIPAVMWFEERSAARLAVWNALPWILAALAGLKVWAAVWVARRLYDSRLVGDGVLVAGAAGWLAAVLALRGLLVWLVDTPVVPGYLLLLVAILATPLARVSAAPLALAWNRHR